VCEYVCVYVCVCAYVCREAERQRGREAERQRGREAERQRGREAERQRGRERGENQSPGTSSFLDKLLKCFRFPLWFVYGYLGADRA